MCCGKGRLGVGGGGVGGGGGTCMHVCMYMHVCVYMNECAHVMISFQSTVSE